MSKIKLLHASNFFLKRPLCNEPSISIIHALLEDEGLDCECLYNPSMEQSLIENYIVDEETDYLGICLNFFSDINKIIMFCEYIKKRRPSLMLVMFGLFANCDEKFLLDNFGSVFNFIIKGEPELVFLDIVRDRKSTTECSVIYSNNQSTTKLPPPKKNLKNELSTCISRGCYNKCLFCEEHFDHYICREVDDVILEIKNHVLTSDRNKDCWLFFMDLDFLSISVRNPDYIVRLVNAWKRENLKIKFTIQTRADRIVYNVESLKLLKSIGLQSVTLGVESGSMEILNRYNKNIKNVEMNIEAIETLKKLGILHNLSFIMYEPLTTLDIIKQNLHFFKLIDFPIGAIPSQPPVSFYDKLIILHGSKTFEYYKNKIEYTIDNYNVSYQFVDKEVNLFYEKINMWRMKIAEIIEQYYYLIDKLLYSNNDFSKSLRIQRLGITIKKLDLDFMTELVSAIQNRKNIDEVIQRYVTIMNSDIKEKINSIYAGSTEGERHFRGWHGPMNIILKDDDTVNGEVYYDKK